MVSRSPVAIGIDVWRATFAIPFGSSGGVGSSNQSGSYFSSFEANLTAPDGVNCPWVPKRMSALVPTASRIFFVICTANSMRSNEGWRPSNLAFGGADGQTVYVTDEATGTIGAFDHDVPGANLF